MIRRALRKQKMKTDPWFYRLLKAWPAGFFDLLGLPVAQAQRYSFESVELKKEGWRIDGVFRPHDNQDPVYFLEIQGYSLPAFYANFFAKVFGFLEVNDPGQDWRAVAIFLQRAFEPAQRQPYDMLLACPKVTRIYLDELPVQEDPPLAQGVWQLVGASESRAKLLGPKVLARATRELTDSVLRRRVIQLLQEFLIERFAALSPQELQAMLNLPDFRDTRFFREAFEEGKKKGIAALSPQELQSMLNLPDFRDTRFFREAFEEGTKKGRKTGRKTGMKTGMKKGISLGQRATKEEIAKNFLAAGLPPEIIAKGTGLPVKEIRRLASAKE